MGADGWSLWATGVLSAPSREEISAILADARGESADSSAARS
jgi:hypothetical protein